MTRVTSSCWPYIINITHFVLIEVIFSHAYAIIRVYVFKDQRSGLNKYVSGLQTTRTYNLTIIIFMLEILVLFWSRLIIITILPLPTHGFWIKILDTVNSRLSAEWGGTTTADNRFRK